MAEATSKTGKGISGFLSKDTAGLPNWAWLVVLGAGLAAAYIIPKFFGNSSQTPATNGTSASDSSGIGLAVDPTTGLPYAVEGLVPSGGTTGGTTGPAGPQGPPGPQGPAGPSGCPPLSAPAAPPHGFTYVETTDANGCPVWKLTGSGLMPPFLPNRTVNPSAAAASTAKYVTAQKWPSPLGSLSGIAKQNGVTLQRLEQLNPQIKNPNLIYAGQKVRVA